MKRIIVLLIVFYCGLASAQVAINTNGALPHASSILDLKSTDKGLLIPRMTTIQRNAIVLPATGLQIYNTDNNCLETWNSNGWLSVCGGSILFNGVAIVGTAPDSWIQKGNFGGMARYEAVGFSIGNKGYIGTGNDLSNRKDFWQYDPATNSWTQKADVGGTTRTGAVGFSIGSKGYIGTGSNGTGGNGPYKKDFWEYDPLLNTWTQKADFGGTERYYAVGFSIGNKGYIGTGYDGTARKDFWEYDPSDVSNGNDLNGNPMGKWTQKSDLGGSGRQRSVGFSIGTKGYIGGAINNAQSGDFWEYNPTGNVWTQKADFGVEMRINAVGFSIGNKGYIGTGNNYFSDYGSKFWEYNPSTNAWMQKTDLPGTARTGAAGFSIGNKGYIGTGYDGVLKTDLWEYNQ